MSTNTLNVIQDTINKVKETRYSVIEYKGYEIAVSEDTWTKLYHVAVKDTLTDKYIFESNLHKVDTLLYKNIEMIMEYIGV